jgi:hypothetical protein
MLNVHSTRTQKLIVCNSLVVFKIDGRVAGPGKRWNTGGLIAAFAAWRRNPRGCIRVTA